MAMAIVTTDIVHALSVGRVASLDVLIELAQLRTVDIQNDILVSLAEREVILRDIVRSSEIIDDPISAADTCMTDHGEEPSDQRQWSPSNAERESGFLRIHL